ncbi:RNA 2',3'-cyclic phosphodiesterase [Paludibacterium denitrificans]|uniref:RNA 2',3'-cyclic phosphodiesterase n=1 Tax=Paludibacterium denitrificans TaxID=2675226 RepID=A0A844GDV1_9NEIS|nr:RNA 2',3'-cyclic phosphodiesterase [Paludibacterium denitrificans]MTD33097.1 RNA 2',3'-cyclic phosphodiesterase [Paludibacterium denitrificans]
MASAISTSSEPPHGQCASGFGQPQSASHRLRLFLAVWPGEATHKKLRAAQSALQQQVAGRPVKPALWHLTLAFLGDVPAQRLTALTTALAPLARQHAALCLHFNRCGSWRNGIGYLAPAHTPASLLALVHAIRQQLHVCGIASDSRHYTPHLTLLRHTREVLAPQPVPAIDYRLDHLALVQSTLGPHGAHYRQLARWPLGHSQT